MARQIESTAAWCDHLTNQFKLMPKDLAGTRLGGHTALLKWVPRASPGCFR